MTENVTSVQKGEQFRDRVCSLLRAAGFTVLTEPRLIYKKVDLLAEKKELGRIRRFAIECKDHHDRITKSQSVGIITDYQPLLTKGMADEVWVITNLISSDARFHIDSTPSFRAFAFAELKHIFADFSRYLYNLRLLYQREEIQHYYVPIISSDGTDIEDYVLRWLDSPDSTPLAIEAGYGKGKTTFSLHLCNLLIEASSRNDSARIPLYIPLGDISTEQSVSGLVSNSLARLPYVSNYSFELMFELNRDGCFVLIFDGFDEMKHGLSFEQFRYNFAQILTLYGPRSKIIVLGRPTAFLSENERAFILLGNDQTHGGQQHRDPSWPAFKIFDISDWTIDQAHDYIKRYYPIVARKYALNEPIDGAAEKIKQLVSGVFDQLIARPVHAKMLVEVAADTTGSLGSLTEYHLYDRFVHSLLRRETLKPGRDRRIGVEQRREFAATVAWWMWEQNGLRSARAEQIPYSTVSKYRPPASDYDYDTLRRELVSGCFVDKNDAAAIYFPHRSFQEFLVSEHIVETEFLKSNFAVVSQRVDSLICQFITDRLDARRARDFVSALLGYAGSPVSFELLQTAALVDAKYGIMKRHGFSLESTWGMVVHLMSISGLGSKEFDINKYNRRVRELLEKDERRDTYWSIIGLMHLSGWLCQSIPNAARNELLKSIIQLMMKYTPIREVVEDVIKQSTAESITVTRLSYGLMGYLFFKTNIGIVSASPAVIDLRFPLSSFVNDLMATTRSLHEISNLVVPGNVEYGVQANDLIDDSLFLEDSQYWRAFFGDEQIRRRIVT